MSNPGLSQLTGLDCPNGGRSAAGPLCPASLFLDRTPRSVTDNLWMFMVASAKTNLGSLADLLSFSCEDFA
jgi:hypothetical protein